MSKNKKRLITISIIILIFISLATFFIIKFNNKPLKEEVKEPSSDFNTEENYQEENTSIDDKDNELKTEENNKDSDDKNDKKENNNTDKPITSDKNTNKNESNSNKQDSINKDENNNSNNEANNNENNKLEIEEKPEAKPDLPIVEDKNNIKRKAMENTYGLKILYGNEIDGYKPKNITPTKLTSESDIENYLNRLNIELDKYPKGFFNDFNKRGMPLTIYLIKSANGAFSGFTDYQFMNNIKLTLATDYNFEYTIHHELMHYIDCYLDIVMYPSNPYSEYETLNPLNFTYENATGNQIYNMGTNARGAYFISSYGATHIKEDRAEVFKYMTARAYAPIGCFEPNEIIRKKAELISKQIRTYFPSVTGTAHWDRFIK